MMEMNRRQKNAVTGGRGEQGTGFPQDGLPVGYWVIDRVDPVY